MQDKLNQSLIREKIAYEDFKKLYKLKDVNYNTLIVTNRKDYLTKDWTAKDYLSDIVYWHESFARNISDVSANRETNEIKLSLCDATIQAITENKNCSINTLLRRLTKAQKTIEAHILNNDIGSIPYRRGSREYSRIEYLDIRTSEFGWHFWSVVESFAGSNKKPSQ